MGEVYRACEARLKLDAAIKILTDEFAGDPDVSVLAVFRKDSSTIGHQVTGSPRDVRAKPATIGSLVAARMSNTLN